MRRRLRREVSTLRGDLRAVKARCDCRWSDTTDRFAEAEDAEPALPGGAVVLSRMPTLADLLAAQGFTGDAGKVLALLESLVIQS